MCNYCQTSSIFSNSCGRNGGWRVQRICYDCNGNVYVIVTNGCVCRRLHCNTFYGYQDADEGNTTATNGNGCCGGCTATRFACAQNATATSINGGCGGCTATRFACAQNAVTTNANGCRCATATATATQDSELYYARLYGLYPYGSGRSCCCGGNTVL